MGRDRKAKQATLSHDCAPNSAVGSRWRADADIGRRSASRATEGWNEGQASVRCHLQCMCCCGAVALFFSARVCRGTPVGESGELPSCQLGPSSAASLPR
eukprot:scaffold1314_cov386-Pavlova_lutheri.AAC.3